MEDENTKTQQQIALVTGSSSGIGFETSILLARNKIYTFATMRNLSNSKMIRDIAKHGNLPLKTIPLDVTKRNSVKNAIEKIKSEQGRIDILVNNAGYSLIGALEQLTITEIKHEFETNFFGVINLIQRVLPIMRKQRNGRIINISSLGGRIGFPLSSAYNSSKFALEGLSESLRYEVNGFGIKIILVEPGVIKTNFVNNLKIGKQVVSKSNNDKIHSENLPYSDITQNRLSAFKSRFEKGSPPKDVAATVLQAATAINPKFRYIVGQDAFKLLNLKKNISDEIFGKIVMKSVLQGD
jgi:NAD(P)-dependent dehydrogenase (short-subunit alcohol dehydrogenase family)